jgi:hypothetical protein
MSQTNSTFQNHTYKLGFIIWSFIIVGGYFLLSFDIPLAPYGESDEEIDYFMNAALVAAGQKPFVLAHPGAWVQQLGGGIQYLLGFSITEDQQLFLNIARIIPFGALLFSMYYFYRSFYSTIGFWGVSSAFALFLSWPAVQQYTAMFSASAFIVSLSLYLIIYLFNILQSSKQTLSHYVVFGLLSGFALNTKFILLVFLTFLILAMVVIQLTRQGFRGTLIILVITVTSLFIGYTIAFIPNIEFIHYPFINLLRNLFIGSVQLYGNGITGKLEQLYTVSPLLVAPYAIATTFLVYAFLRYRKELFDKNLIVLCILGLLTVALIISAQPNDNPVILTSYRHLLPYAVIWPLLIVITWPYITQYSTHMPKIIAGFAVLLLANSSYQFNNIHNAARQRQVTDAEIVKQGLEEYGINSQNRIAGTYVFSDALRGAMVKSSVQNGGGYFTPKLVQGTPSETLFYPGNLPIESSKKEKQLREFTDRLSTITCQGQTDLIKVRKNILTSVAAFTGESLGKYCIPLVEYFVLGNFEKRIEYYNFGLQNTRHNNRENIFGGYGPEDIPGVIIYDIISEYEAETIYSEISRLYKIEKSVDALFGKRHLRIIWLDQSTST